MTWLSRVSPKGARHGGPYGRQIRGTMPRRRRNSVSSALKRHSVFHWVLWLYLGIGFPLQAQEPLVLTPEQVIVLVREKSGEVAIAREEVSVAEGERLTARTPVNNPEVSVAAGPRWGGQRTVDLAATVSLPLEIYGQRAARGQSAESVVAARQASLKDTQRLAIQEALVSYYRALRALLAATLLEERVNQDNEILRVAQRRRDAGDASLLEVQLVQAELAKDRAALIRARAETEALMLGLLAQLAMPASAAVQLAPGFPTLEAPAAPPIVADRLSERPDLVALRREVQAAEARVRLEQRSGLPNPTFTIEYGREEAAEVIKAGIGLPLPVLNRNRGAIASAQAEVRRSQALLDARTRAVEVELLSAHRRAVAAVEAQGTMSEAETLSQDTLKRTLRAYEAGELDLISVLTVRREALNTRRDLLDIQFEAATAVVEFKASIGGW